MNFDKKTLVASLALVMGFTHQVSQAATLNAGDTLTINTGVLATDANGNPTNVTISWFGMDSDGNGKIAGTEKTALSQGTTGLVIGTVTTAGASHSGPVAGGDTNAITDPWAFFGNTGSDYATIGVTGSTVAGLDFSGWTVTWNGIAAIPMGTGAWGTGFSNGVANIVWDGVYGHSYTLDYAATVPLAPADGGSGFGGVKYRLHLEGVVQAATDTTPPTVSSTSPASGATNVSVSGGGVGGYTVTFSEPMDVTTVVAGSLSVSGGVTVGAPTTSDNTTFTFPLSGLANSTLYTVTFNAGPKDAAGNAVTLPANKIFTTAAAADSTSPTLSSKTPAASATDVVVTSSLSMTFSEAMDATTVGSAFTLTAASGSAVTGTMSTADGLTFTFGPSSTLSYSTTYTATLTTTAKDAVGNAIATTQTWTFTTEADPSADTSPAVSGVPASGGSGGGCAMNPASHFDLSLLLAALGGLGFAARRRKRG